ncbi:MAG: hypothetical protein M1814_003828 [Vezdaea aestivalis]|nr:MAG: hypothetical protein M1814_003828 [Vezdaea aestivalis]
MTSLPSPSAAKPLPPTPSPPRNPSRPPPLPRTPPPSDIHNPVTFASHLEALQTRLAAITSAQKYLNAHIDALMHQRISSGAGFTIPRSGSWGSHTSVRYEDDILRLVEQEQGFALRRAFLELEVENAQFASWWRSDGSPDSGWNARRHRALDHSDSHGLSATVNRRFDDHDIKTEAGRRLGLPLEIVVEEYEDERDMRHGELGFEDELTPEPLDLVGSKRVVSAVSPSRYSRSSGGRSLDVEIHLGRDTDNEQVIGARSYWELGLPQLEESPVSRRASHRRAFSDSKTFDLGNLLATRGPTPPLFQHPAFRTAVTLSSSSSVDYNSGGGGWDEAYEYKDRPPAVPSKSEKRQQKQVVPASLDRKAAYILGLDPRTSAGLMKRSVSASDVALGSALAHSPWAGQNQIQEPNSSKLSLNEESRLGGRAINMVERFKGELDRITNSSPQEKSRKSSRDEIRKLSKRLEKKL